MNINKKLLLFLPLVFILFLSPKNESNISANMAEGIMLRGHFENIGWSDWVDSNGEYAELLFDNLRLEAIELHLENIPNASINYQSHVQNYGWLIWRTNGETSGTVGESLRLEGVKIALDNAPENYSVLYQCKLENNNWTDWKSDGELCGTTGQKQQINGIRVKLVSSKPKIAYRAYIDKKGWSSSIEEGSIIENNNIPISGLKLNLENVEPNSNILYSTFNSKTGWSPSSNNSISGSPLLDEFITAIKISLINLDDYVIKYRIKVDDDTWSTWFKDGDICELNGSPILDIQANIYRINEEPENIDLNSQNLYQKKSLRPSSEENIKINNSDILTENLNSELFLLTNKFREENNIPMLTWNEDLYASSKYKSESMANLNYFGHENPNHNNGDFAYLMMNVFNYRQDLIGENLFASKNIKENADTIFNAWKNSPEHVANLLNEDFHSIGISVIITDSTNNNYSLYATQHFSSELFK